MNITKKYIIAWWNAFRAFSLIIAIDSCLLGVVLAFKDGYHNYLNAILVMLGGIFIQSGVNLINDFFEFKQRKVEDKMAHLQIFGSERDNIEWIIFFSGLGFFALTIPIGLFLVYRTGIPLLILGLVGFVGGYFYTGEPFNYKKKGLGVFLVFFLMGVFMIVGSYYAVSGTYNKSILLISLPISSLVAHMLLTNELRDYEADAGFDIPTLTVRIGYIPSLVFYFVLLAFTYVFTFVLSNMWLFSHPLFVLLGLPFLIKPSITLIRNKGSKRSVIPDMMIHHTVFGICFIGSYIYDMLII